MIRYASTHTKPVRPSRIRFGLLSAEDVERMSVCAVTETTLYYRGLPATGGLLDPLMGTVDRRHFCATCMNDTLRCQGHPGHIKLAFPMYHIGFVDTVVKILRCVCYCCSHVCLTSDERDTAVGNASGKHRLNAVHHTVRNRRTCVHCGLPRPNVQRTSLGIRVDWPADVQWQSETEEAYCTQQFTSRDALSILRNIPDDDVVLLGFDPMHSHPMNMITQNLVVCPPCTRPAIYSSEGSRSRGQNDITVRYIEILKRSNEVAAALRDHTWETVPAVDQELLECLQRLQYEVYMLVNNTSRVTKPPGMGRNSSNVNGKSLHERLKGKEGRVRGNLMGKRVDFSARCVITPDAHFECDRVGVPYRIAMSLTVPEIVNKNNILELHARVKNGSKHVHGALNIIHTDGTVTNIDACRNRGEIVLRMGDVVERFLADDDVVVFNRQPSLHMHSMQAHRVRLMPGHTFRISLVVASPYNADFDGDEMNLHVPQGRTASAECAMLMGIAQNCIGSQSNRPVMGIVQDSLLGMHLISHTDVLLDHPHMCRIVGCVRHAPRRLPPCAVSVTHRGRTTRHWTGRQVISLLLPDTLYVEPERRFDGRPVVSDQWTDADLPVVVLQGTHVTGVLRKAHVGTGAGGLVDTITREHGGVHCMRFRGDAQRVIHEVLLQRGHHVGIDDVMLSSDGHERVLERLNKATALCEEIQREVLDASEDQQRVGEMAILRILSKTLLQTGSIVNEYMDERNAIKRMVGAGSKGTFINMSQICAALGQQSIEGARIRAEKGTRTLPCFPHNDVSLLSHGMIQNSFSLGLSPPELFFHAIGGREGLVDTAVKTSQSGYIQRRMNKSMEECTVRYADGTIRNSTDDIVSFRWGDDGFHPARLERVRLPVLDKLTPAAVRAMFEGDEEIVALVTDAVAKCVTVKRHVLYGEYDNRVLLPFHPLRIEREMERLLLPETTDADPDDTYANVRRRVLEYVRGRSCVVTLAILCLMRPTRIRRLATADVDRIWNDLTRRVEYAESVAGESVGCIAAQSIGEPCTQMTLNTFHTAGCAEKNVTLGIPRFKELLDATKSPKTPCTTIRFVAPYATSPDVAEYMAHTLPLIRLGDIVSTCDIVLDPDPTCTTVPDDEWIVLADRILDHADGLPSHSSKYVIRLKLNEDVMRMRHMTPTMIRRILTERLATRAHVASSERNAVEWVVRIRFLHLQDMLRIGGLSQDHETILCHRALNVLLETVLVCGHPSITSTSTVAVSRGTDTEHVVHAYGNVLLDCCTSDCVDWNRCTSNDVWEVYHTLGIEACAHVLFEQMKSVVSFDGAYVDDRHILMIVDSICRTGTIMPLNRHGINRTDASPLMRCSFEETTDILCDAAGFAEHENAQGISTAIMSGQTPNMGTGTVTVLVPNTELRDYRLKPAGRVLRSTCRSYVATSAPECLEYVLDTQRVASVRTLSPPTIREGTRKRARFRMVSPPRK